MAHTSDHESKNPKLSKFSSNTTEYNSTLESSPYFASTSSKRPREEKEIADDSGKKARKDPSETATGIMVEQPFVTSGIKFLMKNISPIYLQF